MSVAFSKTGNSPSVAERLMCILMPGVLVFHLVSFLVVCVIVPSGRDRNPRVGNER